MCSDKASHPLNLQYTTKKKAHQVPNVCTETRTFSPLVDEAIKPTWEVWVRTLHEWWTACKTKSSKRQICSRSFTKEPPQLLLCFKATHCGRQLHIICCKIFKWHCLDKMSEYTLVQLKKQKTWCDFAYSHFSKQRSMLMTKRGTTVSHNQTRKIKSLRSQRGGGWGLGALFPESGLFYL